ncbi:MAG TPA: LysE family translocator [Xanthobacteraceae bacterium]
MTLQTWWLYLGAVFLVSATPGPNLFFVLTRSIRFGFGRTLLAMLGCLLALVLMLSASALGLGALLVAAPTWFDLFKYAGAAYLIYLGIRTWFAHDDPAEVLPDAAATPRRTSNGELFRGGFLVSISNPKLLVFAAALFPQFINESAPRLPQFAILVATFIAMEFLWQLIYAVSGRKLAHYLAEGVWRRRLNRASGTIFAGFGIGLRRYRPGE